MIGIQASHHCWCVLPEVIVYAYTQSAFYHLDPCNANPSGSQQSCRFLRSWLFGSSFAFSRQMLPNDCHQKRDGLITRAVSSPIQVSVQLQEQLMSMLSAHHWWRQSDLHCADYWITALFTKEIGSYIILVPDHFIWNLTFRLTVSEKYRLWTAVPFSKTQTTLKQRNQYRHKLRLRQLWFLKQNSMWS